MVSTGLVSPWPGFRKSPTLTLSRIRRFGRASSPQREIARLSIQPVPNLSARDAAGIYIAKGWQVVPLEPKTKIPPDEGWIRIVFKADDFGPNDNIGLRWTNGLVDVDCDAMEVVAVVDKFLPPTGAIYGRPGKPRSHWVYRSAFEKTLALKDLQAEKDKATLVEIRVNNQSMAPPSIHPSGEVVAWDGILGEAAEVESETLLRCVRLLGTCGLIARFYNPPGNRHDWGLALAGVLHHIGVTESEAKLLISEAGKLVHDPDYKDRVTAVRNTYAKADGDHPVAAFKALKEGMIHGAEFLASLNRIWGTGTSAFITGKGDAIVANSQENVRRALEKMEIVLSYDLFNDRSLVKYKNFHGPLEDNVRNRIWLDIDSTYHFRPSPEFFDVVLQDTAYKNSFHPVRDYLKTLKWDGTPRLNTWLVEYGGANDSPYVRAVGALVLIAAVRRVVEPGTKFDELLVLESEQGQMKSSALQALCPKHTWFSDDLPLNVDAKQIIERTAGKWIIEASELTGLGKREGDHLKSMLSRQVDGPVRMAYARLPKEVKRQFIVIGTTNSHQYLHDATGNRRFWPVRVEKFDVGRVIADRDQLWAEAAYRESQGESIRLDPKLYTFAAMQQERRRTDHPWEAELDRAFSPEEVHRLAPEDIWEILHIPIDKRTVRNNVEVGEIMQRLGFRSMTVKDANKKVVKGWGRDVVKGMPKLEFE